MPDFRCCQGDGGALGCPWGMLHTRKGCLTAWIPPAELGEGTRPCSQGMELGGSVPTCPQPHSDLGVFKGGFDKPSPVGFGHPQGREGGYTPRVMNPMEVSGLFCVSLPPFQELLVFTGSSWRPSHGHTSPLPPTLCPARGSPPPAGGPACLSTCQDLAEEAPEKEP